MGCGCTKNKDDLLFENNEFEFCDVNDHYPIKFTKEMFESDENLSKILEIMWRFRRWIKKTGKNPPLDNNSKKVYTGGSCGLPSIPFHCYLGTNVSFITLMHMLVMFRTRLMNNEFNFY